ncbi:hypothetical protein CJI51_03755 [Bifidobacteriaceae bacterium WP021]|uniref:Uncharacterized protein n=1 Tax=Gardnerella swidsinskii TaxID=2792979 RepID=A0ABN4V1F6_9BIFI|nr:hypothetical protein BVL65_06450 [Gardnerella vaginalis]RFT35700.1 hypothetical protein CG402_00035 [Bifidobacteriaceae bacterium NR020]RIY26499.1 hypothetical protein CJI51_03755 [Bifidobacteriaceae bacterium WP021]RIY30352.1 hypothetical protein CJI49_03635 [Bifidobacteriaceae bacterium NR016]
MKAQCAFNASEVCLRQQRRRQGRLVWLCFRNYAGLSTQARTRLCFLYIPNEKSTCRNFQQVRLESTRQVER